MTERKSGKPLPQPESPSSWRMIVTMAGIGLFSGILIVVTFQLTSPVIKVNKTRALERAIFEVVPGAEKKAVFKLVGETLQALEGEEETATKYYACFDEEDRLVGVAVEASGMGFQDRLRILYGYSPSRHNVIGMTVLESKETPGLGDKIEKDPDFKANFDALDTGLASDGAAIEHPIVLVKHGEKLNPWEIESITGATISSRAIANILRESTSVTVPIIERNLSLLEGAAR